MRPRLLLAPDKFKGSLSAEEICHLLSAELSERGEIISCPLSDGGEGFVDTMRAALGGQLVPLTVADPLGRPVVVEYARCGEVAVMEMARASGLLLLAPEERDPWRASTRGTGEMMVHAAAAGARKILLGIGGSATNDGGVGMAQALGFRFQDSAGAEITDVPARLMDVRKILPPERPFPIPVEVACDVDNPLLGALGASQIYGPQKGVRHDQVSTHEARLAHLITLVEAIPDRTSQEPALRSMLPHLLPGSGAAGGLGYGLMVFAGAHLAPGFDLVAAALHLEQKLAWADVIITGEGQLDQSSLSGKAPVALARHAHRLGKRVIALCGRCDKSALPQLEEIFDQIIAISPPDLPTAEAMQKAAAHLRAAASKLELF